MSLIVLEDVSLTLGRKTIIDGLNMRIAEGDRLGLVGPNGSGKSSLLRLLAGEQVPDGGQITRQNNMRLGYLPQDLSLDHPGTVIDFVMRAAQDRSSLEKRIQELEVKLQDAAKLPEEQALALATELGDAHELLARIDEEFGEHAATQILAGLGFSDKDLQRPMSEFSGGWRMRAVLASLLFQKPDLLLFDEPTNHLDMPSVAWFGAFLRSYKGAFVLICHDREFLNEQINRMISYEPEGVRTYPGNYERYLQQRAEEQQNLINRAKNLEREREKTEQFIRRFRAQANKAAAVQSRIKALEKMDEVIVYEDRRVMNFRFPPCERAGNEVLQIDNLAKRYGDLEVFSGVNLRVRRGDKIGIIGVNGAGKTTLLRILAGEIEASGGEYNFGHNTQVGYYAQHHSDTLHKNLTILDEVKYHADGATLTELRTILGGFLFGEDEIDKKVGVLSGGERARVALAKLLISPGNVMLMDEPTNHLDLESSEALAEALSRYDGTLLFVSHNRSFVRKLADKIWDVRDGKVEVYPGTLDEYMDSERSKRTGESKSTDAPRRLATGKQAASTASKSERPKESKQERRRRQAEERKQRKERQQLEKSVADLEARIANLETEQAEANAELELPETYEDAKRRDELLAALQTRHEKLEELTQRWESAQLKLESLL